MKKISRICLILACIMTMGWMMTACTQHAGQPDIEGVVDAGTYTEIDYDYIEKYGQEVFDGWHGMCTSAAKVLDDGSMIVGRNLDMVISHKPVYYFRTNVPGCYETITLSYNTAGGPDYDEVLKNGIDEETKRVLPFFSPDILNSEGLFIEMNMRLSEPDENGVDRFGNSGTNPSARARVSELALTRYLAEHCATVEEAVAYARTLDIYTMNKGGYQWGLSYMMADATGAYGVMEIADNEIVWLPGEAIHTNFYLNPAWAKVEQYKVGKGRYELAKAGLDQVASMDDMAVLMGRVTGFQQYDPDTCLYDPITDMVGNKAEWTYDYVTDPANAGEMIAACKEQARIVRDKSREELKDDMCYFESVLSEVVDCSHKLIRVKFFEDAEKVMEY